MVFSANDSSYDRSTVHYATQTQLFEMTFAEPGWKHFGYKSANHCVKRVSRFRTDAQAENMCNIPAGTVTRDSDGTYIY